MIYFLKKTTPSKKGLYLQIYINYYDPVTKGKKTKSYKSLGYVSDLIQNGIEDPVSYYTEEIKRMNNELNQLKEVEIGTSPVTYNLGYFLIKSIIDKLGVDRDLDIMTQFRKSEFKSSKMLRDLIYAQVISPGSKLKAFEKVIPTIFGSEDYSYDQILDFINFIGSDYEKYVELYNHYINKVYGMNTDEVYFDCTNYYFEIDLEDDLRRKGPSKENRKSPIISQALLLDRNRIPIGMKMYPGNESEKPKLREMIEDIKERYDINGKTIQVADKGLNCAENIYNAHIEGKDGYIFSKSIKGKNISKDERNYLFNDDNPKLKWKYVYNTDGTMHYKYKEYRGSFHYKFKNKDSEVIEFTTKEKRIFTYNESLAKKQKLEINKMIEKAENIMSIKEALKEDYGDSIKYVLFTKDNDNVKVNARLNYDKIQEDLMMCGYNLLVSSELNMSADEIYKTYHGLSKIEESFRIMKSYLDARPVFLQEEDSIYGHFLVCYLSLVILRLLELKEFNEKICVSEIVNYIRDFKITMMPNNEYVNNTIKTSYYIKIKEALGLSNIGHLYLTNKGVKNILDYEF